MSADVVKISAKLVEHQRQEKWWDDDVICPVPYYPDPTISGTQICVALGGLVYSLDANFGYAIKWEFDLSDSSDQIAIIESPQFWGKDRVVLTALTNNGICQGIIINLKSRQIKRTNLEIGRAYHPLYIFEDRYPIKPVLVNENLVFVSPYGNTTFNGSSKKKTLGRSVKVRYQPLAVGRTLIFHLDNEKEEWLEWRSFDTFQKTLVSERFPTRYGITTGYCGTAPLHWDGGIVCGFGNQLIGFSTNGKIIWQFFYPHIASIDDTEPLQLVSGEQVIYETYSEVNITSNLYRFHNHLYFTLSDCHSHISYLTKMTIDKGGVIWTYRIDGLSQGFTIVRVSEQKILLQNAKDIWIIAQDGRICSELELDVECASCSNLVYLTDDKYVFLADFGVYEVEIDIGVKRITVEDTLRDKTAVETSAKDANKAEETSEKVQIFLCYAKPDRQNVSRLYDFLDKKQFDPWMDEKKLLPGMKWKPEIEKAIHDSDFFIACLSNKSVDRRGFLQKEIKIALDILDQMLDEDIYFIPARLEECEIPKRLRDELQWANLYERDGYDQLVKAIYLGMERRNVGGARMPAFTKLDS